MDMFMDKLGQRLNAQEIIKANTLADTEELNHLRSQIADYNDCLVKLQMLIEDGAARLRSAKVDGGEIDRLVEESIAKIRVLQQDTAALSQLQKNLSDRLDEADRKQGERLDGVSRILDEKLEQFEQHLNEKSDDESVKQLTERMDVTDENIHKECVKVYRNVQAVVVEESGKQAEALNEARGKVDSLGGRLKVIMGISIAALVFSLAGTLIQILAFLNIL